KRGEWPMRRIGQAVAVLAVLVVSAGLIHAAGTDTGKCAASKSKAAAKRIGARLKCWQKAFTSGAATADSACLSAAETKFTSAISKAEAKGGCAVTGDANALEAAADTCVNSIVALTPVTTTTLGGGGSTTTSTISTTSTTQCPAGQTPCGPNCVDTDSD